MNFGLNEELTGHQNFAGANALTGLRLNVARFGIYWSDLNYTHMDAVFPQLSALGQRPIATVYGTSAPDPDAYAQAIADLHHTYPSLLLQVWNEPNNPTFGGLDPSLVRTLMSKARAATGGPLLGTPMSPTPGWKQYARDAYAGSGLPVSLHIYPSGSQPMNEVMVNYQFGRGLAGGRGVHVTELGFQRKFYPINQADLSAAAFRFLKSLGAQTIIFHRLAEPVPASDWERQARLWFLDAAGNSTAICRALIRERS